MVGGAISLYFYFIRDGILQNLLYDRSSGANRGVQVKRGHWRIPGQEYKTPPFMLGVAVAVKRPVIVLERRGNVYLNPIHVYGALNADGSLVRIQARGGDPDRIQSYRHVDFEAVLTTLRSPPPPALIEFDGVNHHSPFLRPDIAPTEVVDPKDVGNLDEVEEDGVPLEEAPYAAQNIVEQLQEAGAHQMLVDAPDLTGEEMNNTMRRLGLSWEDEKQTTMIGTANTYDMIDQVVIFLVISGSLFGSRAEGARRARRARSWLQQWADMARICDGIGRITMLSMLSSDKKQRLATGEEPLSLLCLGDDPLRCLLMLNCIGRRELSNLRLSCKVLLEIGALVYDKYLCVWLAFDGTTVFGPGSNSTSIDLRQRDTNNPKVTRILSHAVADPFEYMTDALRKSFGTILDMQRSDLLPDSVEYIGERASYNSRITTLLLPESVKYIGDDAFSHSELTTLRLQASVAHVGNGAFDCSSLRGVSEKIDFFGELWWLRLRTVCIHLGISFNYLK